MSLKRLLGGAVVGTGGLVLANRRLRRRAGELDAPLGRPPEQYRWRGLDVAYTEAGDPSDPDLLLVHGVHAAASSHEFRRVVDDLAGSYHVLAPDLPGFGRSARPPLAYSGSTYVSFLEDFLRDVADRPTVVASSLSAAYAAVAASETGEADVEGCVFVCPTSTTSASRRPGVRRLLRSPVVGEACFNVLASRPAIRYFLVERAFADPGAIDGGLVEYAWRSAHQEGARFAPASFVAGFLDVDADLGSAIGGLDAPTTLVWGRETSLPPLETGRELADAADARLIVFDRAALLPHVEHPDAFVEQVRRATPEASAGDARR